MLKPNKILRLHAKTLSIVAIFGLYLMPIVSHAQTELTVREQVITDYRPVVARLESSDTATARARLSGVVTRLNIDEGSIIKKGQTIAIIRDETINPQIAALDAKIAGIENQLSQFQTELDRAEKLLVSGHVTPARRDQAQTAVNVTQKELTATKAQRSTLTATRTKGVITAPSDARVIEVSVVKGSIVSPGEVIAKLATLDGVVRLALPERHAGQINEGETLQLRLPARSGETKQATITKIYPELRGGAVIADAVVDGGLSALVGERVDVLVPVGDRRALRIPKAYVTTRYGIDFVKVHVGDHIIDAPLTLSNPQADSQGYVEVLSGLHAGDVIEKAADK